MRHRTFIALLAFTAPAFAQVPQSSPTDDNRLPAYQGPGSRVDDNRIPALQGAGNVGGIQSFPAQGGGYQGGLPNFPQQTYRSPLSPYLNLTRNRGVNTGINAIDYYNFVRPAQQPGAPNAYAPAAPNIQGRTSGFPNYYYDPESPFEPYPVVRSSGAGPATFQNTQGYFNRYGTIGTGRFQGAGGTAYGTGNAYGFGTGNTRLRR